MDATRECVQHLLRVVSVHHWDITIKGQAMIQTITVVVADRLRVMVNRPRDSSTFNLFLKRFSNMRQVYHWRN